MWLVQLLYTELTQASRPAAGTKGTTSANSRSGVSGGATTGVRTTGTVTGSGGAGSTSSVQTLVQGNSGSAVGESSLL